MPTNSPLPLHRFAAAASLFVVIGLFLLSSSAQGQETADASEEKPFATTTDEPGISVDNLQLLLKPLTKEELTVEAEAWQDLLKAQVQEISQKRIAAQDQPEAVNDLPQMQEAKSRLEERLNVVLNELEAKGGDVATYRKYIAAQSGVAIDVTDTSAMWTMLQSWLVSDQGGKRWMWNIIKFLVILLAFYFAAKIASSLVARAVSRLRRSSQLLIDFLSKFVKQVVLIIGLIVGLSALEVNITPLLAAVGAAGFVIGFALQGTLSNFASGMLILAYRPFDVGDVIEAAGVSGIVDSVSLFSTHVRSFDNKLMIVPNNDIWGSTITNATASKTRRVDMVFGIGYDDDIDKAKGILEKLVREHELVLDDPAPVVQLNELADSSVNFICRPWTNTGDYWTVYWDITRSVKAEFDRNDISIPFPQRDVHVFQQNEALLQSGDESP